MTRRQIVPDFKALLDELEQVYWVMDHGAFDYALALDRALALDASTRSRAARRRAQIGTPRSGRDRSAA